MISRFFLQLDFLHHARYISSTMNRALSFLLRIWASFGTAAVVSAFGFFMLSLGMYALLSSNKSELKKKNASQPSEVPIPFPYTALPEKLRSSLIFLSVFEREGETFHHLALGNEVFSVPDGKPFYLRFQDGLYSISEKPELIRIIPSKKTPFSADFRISVGGEYEEVLSKHVTRHIFDFALPVYKRAFTLFSRACLYPSDKLIDLYAGEKFGELRNKVRLMSDRIVFLGEGETKGYDAQLKPAREGDAVIFLQCEKIGDVEARFRLVDEKGIFVKQIILPLNQNRTEPVDPSGILIGPYMRSNRSFFATLSDKKILIRTGDWITCHRGHWKLVSRPEEIEQLLFSVPSEPVIIIDKIAGDRKEIRYSYFDANRVCAHHGSLNM
ncbi:MAG: hypothetical protein A3F09_00015 [Chlamydiae bacterium RIFCSPHIGHO2_12_FULL_49_11]|nr:MAG: hypothetical protein A3F09_00015 [Chlamydiae bacterium RIFCSPHIGHO2_12_FULL_49_11]